MPILRHSGKKAVKFLFEIHLISLSRISAKGKLLLVRWRRGSGFWPVHMCRVILFVCSWMPTISLLVVSTGKREGLSRAVFCDDRPEVTFDETLTVKATLYKDGDKPYFDKKMIDLDIQETRPGKEFVDQELHPYLSAACFLHCCSP